MADFLNLFDSLAVFSSAVGSLARSVPLAHTATTCDGAGGIDPGRPFPVNWRQERHKPRDDHVNAKTMSDRIMCASLHSCVRRYTRVLRCTHVCFAALMCASLHSCVLRCTHVCGATLMCASLHSCGKHAVTINIHT